MDITQAIIPAAGIGTRFLPASKIIPKEMMPILNKPAIQYITEEGVRSGIKNFIIITGRNKQSISDHFDILPELETFLKNNNKDNLIKDILTVIENANFTYVRQKEARGLGHAIWKAKHLIKKEYVSIHEKVLSGLIAS